MKAPDTRDWRPKWTNDIILSSPMRIMEALQNGVWKSKIELFTEQCHGSTWISREFNIKERAAYSALSSIEERIRRLAYDAPRVLQKAQKEWDLYMCRVRQQRDHLQREEIIKWAMEGPVEFYLFLVTNHIQKVWLQHSPGMESSSLSAWSKIGYDNQFLWSLKEFESTFL